MAIAAPEVVARTDPFAFAPPWPLTMPEETPQTETAAKATDAVAETWSPDEVRVARTRCDDLLHGIAAITIAEPPFRHGACGAPAPVRLVSLGRSPEVALSPPALVTCEMAVALSTWLERDLQPLAREHLDAEIVTIETMSDYSCRNAYGRAKARLSEHSRANALDIRGFRTVRGDTATLLAGWGPTAREIRTQVAAGGLGEFVTPVAIAEAPNVGMAVAPAPARDFAAASLWNDMLSSNTPSLGFVAPGTSRASSQGDRPDVPPATSWLGGPEASANGKDNRRTDIPATHPHHAEFLRAAHRSACRVFGTVLGPEANAAHRNHFHVDMAARKSGSYCE